MIYLTKRLDGCVGFRHVPAMRLQDVIRAGKSNIRAGEWASGKMPKAKFPLSKAGRRAYNIGSAWRWRFIEFEALDLSFVMRVIVAEGKLRASAHLAIRRDRDCVVIGCYEYHPDLVTGWHLHTICGDLTKAPAGTLVHGPWVKRLPGVRATHRRKAFRSDMEGGLEGWLWGETLRFFRIEEQGPLL